MLLQTKELVGGVAADM